jgi:hypothetical protein
VTAGQLLEIPETTFEAIPACLLRIKARAARGYSLIRPSELFCKARQKMRGQETVKDTQRAAAISLARDRRLSSAGRCR